MKMTLSHSVRLKESVTGYLRLPPDLYLVSREGHRVYSHQALLSLHSSLLDALLTLNSRKDEYVGVSVDASADCIRRFLNIISFGEEAAGSMKDLDMAVKLGHDLGIKLDNLTIKRRIPPVKSCEKINVRKDLFDPSKEYVEDRESLSNFKFKPLISSKNKEVGSRIPAITDEAQKTSPTLPSFPCGHCLKTFHEKKGRSRHYKKVHPNNKFGDAFSRVPSMSEYERSAKKSKPKPYDLKCDKCEKTFNRTSSLKNHMVVHMDVLPFQCKECGKGFGQSGNFRLHMSKHHSIIIPSMKDFSKLSNEIEVSSKSMNENLLDVIDKSPQSTDVKTFESDDLRLPRSDHGHSMSTNNNVIEISKSLIKKPAYTYEAGKSESNENRDLKAVDTFKFKFHKSTHGNINQINNNDLQITKSINHEELPEIDVMKQSEPEEIHDLNASDSSVIHEETSNEERIRFGDVGERDSIHKDVGDESMSNGKYDLYGSLQLSDSSET